MSRGSAAAGSTASSSSPSPRVPPRTTSSASSGACRRPAASATAARSTRSRRACCPCSSGARRGSSSTTWVRRSATARRSASASSRRRTTSTASGRRSTARRSPARPCRGRAGRVHRPDQPGPAQLQRGPDRRAGGRTSSRAPGEPVELAARDVTIHALDLLEWDDSDPGAADRGRRRLAAPPGRTSGRSRGTLASGSAPGPTSARWCGRRRAGSGSRTPIALDDLREAAADGPAGIARVLRPIDAGLEHLPARGRHRRRDPAPRGGPDHRSEARRSRIRDAPIVLAVGPDGTVAAVCRVRRGRAVPAQGARRASGDLRRRGAHGRANPGASR